MISPIGEFTGPLLPTIDRLTVTVRDDLQVAMSAGQLLVVSADGSVSVGDYSPPARA